MGRINFYICFLVLTLSVISFGQQYHFKVYSIEDGLAQSQILALCQDSKGNLWMGTASGGVSRFDGRTFVNFTQKEGLGDNVVYAIEEDQKGNLWFGTLNGVSRFDGKTFTTFTKEDGLVHSRVRSIVEDRDGHMWFGTDGGVSRFDGKTFTNFTQAEGLAHSRVRSIVEGRDGHMWFGTDGGVSRFDGKTFTNFTEAEGLAHRRIRSIIKDRDGHLWFGTDGGVSRFDGKAFTNLTKEDGLLDDVVYVICEGEDGKLWFGTNEGVSQFDGKSFTALTAKEGLSDNRVRSIIQDREGNLWIGTNDGVCQFYGEAFVTFSEQEGLNDIIYTIVEDRDGNMWFGTFGGGVHKYDGKTFMQFTEKEGLSNNRVISSFEDRDGKLWFGTFGGGVSQFDGKTFTNFTEKEGLPHDVVTSILQDQTGDMWFGTFGGVSKFDGKTFTNFTDKDGLNHNQVLDMVEDEKGHLWFGTFGQVSRYDGVVFTTFSDKQEFNFIESLLEDEKGNLWFAKNGSGITKYTSEAKTEAEAFDQFTTGDGLNNDQVLSMTFDDSGNLWVGTTKGIDKLDMETYNRTGKKHFVHYGAKEGFVGIECNQNAVCKDSKGHLWFGSVKKVTKYNPAADRSNTVEPLTHVTNLRLFFEEVDWSTYTDRESQHSHLPNGLTLPYHQNHLTFDFVGISLTIPSKVKYQFRLEGFDENWSPVTREASTTYSNLSPGAYTFKVKASNNDGLWNRESTTYSFVITPPFWQTWWFYMVCIVAITGSLYGLYRVRIKSLERQQAILEDMVTLRTQQLEESQAQVVALEKEATERQMSGGFAHEMRNALAGAQLVMSKALGVDGPEPHVSLNLASNKTLKELYNFLKNQLGEKDLQQALAFMKVIFSNGERLDDILKIINRATSRGLSITQQIMDYSKIGQEQIHATPINMNEIVGRMMNEMREEFAEKGIVTEIHLQSETGIKGDETQFYSMIENMVLNARDALLSKTMKDGEDRTIEVNDEKTDDHYIIRISDNGVGISEANKGKIFDTFFSTKPETGTGLGLGMVKKTVAMYGGEITVTSEEHKGTTFTLLFPVEKQAETTEAS